MFEFLKKKISGFTDKLKETIQGKQQPAEQKPEAAEKQTERAGETAEIPAEPQPAISETAAQPEMPAPVETAPEEPAPLPEKKLKKAKAAQKIPEDEAAQPEFKIGGEDRSALEKVAEVRKDGKREPKAKMGIAKKLFGFIGGKVKITEAEIGDFLEEFELSLFESDVQQDAAEAIVKELKAGLLGKEISAKEDVTQFVRGEIRAALLKTMETGSIDLLSAGAKPVKILFLGTNGAGKTTTIAKVADYLMKKGKSVMLAAGDTFRAASIEQLEEHAARLGVKVVKHKYGSDPAAVAFDAVKAAEAKGIDFVLIDTAGRQETNRNLIEELKKIERVVKPDLKIYVGEAYTGQALLQQASEFDKAIGIDGFILTKIDTDAKGGTAISLLYALKKPIMFVGTGQRYSDLLEFRPEFIIDRII